MQIQHSAIMSVREQDLSGHDDVCHKHTIISGTENVSKLMRNVVKPLLVCTLIIYLT